MKHPELFMSRRLFKKLLGLGLAGGVLFQLTVCESGVASGLGDVAARYIFEIVRSGSLF